MSDYQTLTGPANSSAVQPYPYVEQPYAYGSPPYGYGQPAPKKGNRVVITVVLGALLVGAVVMVAPFLFLGKMMSDANDLTSSFDGSQTQQILDNDLDVTLGDYKAPKSEYGFGSLSVTLKNKGDEKATYRVQVEAVTESGERITDASISADKLAPGQSVTDDLAFIVSDEGKKRQLRKATFNIISVTKSNF